VRLFPPQEKHHLKEGLKLVNRIGKELKEIVGENGVFCYEIICVYDTILKKDGLALSSLKAGVYSLISWDWSPKPVLILPAGLLPI